MRTQRQVNCSSLLFFLSVLTVAWLAMLRLDIHRSGVAKDPRLSDAQRVGENLESGVLGNQIWQFDATQIEEISWRSQTDSYGKLIINSSTLNLLEQMHALLPPAISKSELSRSLFLIGKALPPNSGAQLADLLQRYHQYKRALTASLNAYEATSENDKLSWLFEQQRLTKQYQAQFFTSLTALQLFGRKNHTSDYLNARLAVNLRSDLTQDEKLTRLSVLQNDYQKSLSNFEH